MTLDDLIVHLNNGIVGNAEQAIGLKGVDRARALGYQDCALVLLAMVKTIVDEKYLGVHISTES